MKLSSAALFEAGGIRCQFLRYDEETGILERIPAKAVFVTESTVEGCRRLEAASGATTPSGQRHDFSLGDVVIAIENPDGSTRGSIARGGADGGVAIAIHHAGKSSILPFTGEHMLLARETLLAMRDEDVDLGIDATRALESIEELFDLVRASPDINRFPKDLRGMAFRAVVVDRYSAAEIGVSDTQLARYCTANQLRAHIHAIDPEHMDALTSRGTHADIINEIGVTVGESSGALARSGIGTALGSGLQSRSARANDTLVRHIFGLVTSTPVERISASMMQIEDFEYLREQMLDHTLSGDWVDALGAKMADALRDGPVMPAGDGANDYQFEVTLAEVDGRDFLLVRDQSSEIGPAGYIYSWPKADRRIISDYDGIILANISPEEVPSDAEIDRLAQVLSEMRAETEFDSPLENY